ncbi:hypothetical protein, partial [Pseudomonas aeruginosa]|uniref:hypothetical protein n=1 Tax=Pseudomonas aeruginosa TaxID=287 RepID=UPI003CC686F1
AAYPTDPKTNGVNYGTAMFGSRLIPPGPVLTTGWAPSANEKPGAKAPGSLSACPALNGAH